MEALTDKQRVFIDEYFLCGLNASKAARKAGYKVRQSGAENMANPVIRAEIEQRLAELSMSAAEVLARLADQGRGDMREFIGKSSRALVNHPRGNLIKKFKRTLTTTLVAEKPQTEEKIELELYDAQAALVQIGRYHKLFTDNTDLTSGGQSVTFTVQGVMNSDHADDLAEPISQASGVR